MPTDKKAVSPLLWKACGALIMTLLGTDGMSAAVAHPDVLDFPSLIREFTRPTGEARARVTFAIPCGGWECVRCWLIWIA